MRRSPPVFPLSSPLHNIREVCKQAVLLEDHLFHSSKQCADCIRKHFFALEAFVDEGLSLSNDPKISQLLEDLLPRIVYLQQAWSSKGDPRQIAQQVRALRKRLSPLCFSSSLPAPAFSPNSLGEIEMPGKKIWLDILVAGLGIYFGYFLVDKLGTGKRRR